MSKWMIAGGVCLAVFVMSAGVALAAALWVMGVYNGEVSLRNAFLAKKKAVETGHDTCWKTISQKYSISEDYRETFIEGLKAVAVGREGGSLFKMTTESNNQLGLSTDVFNQMMATIEGQRAMLKREQDTLADIWRQHKVYCETMPNSFLVGARVMPEPVMITSTRTQKAVETGKDDDVGLGSKKDR